MPPDKFWYTDTLPNQDQVKCYEVIHDNEMCQVNKDIGLDVTRHIVVLVAVMSSQKAKDFRVLDHWWNILYGSMNTVLFHPNGNICHVVLHNVGHTITCT